MATPQEVQKATLALLHRFLRSQGKNVPDITDDTDLITDLGCSSEDGVDFVLDLCDEYEFEFPDSFNPFVHDSGKRPRKFGELARCISEYVCNKG